MKSTDSESSEKRDIFQYHFTSWPDHSVPRDTSAFLMFHHKLRSALAVDPGPIVVHCRYLFIYLFKSKNLPDTTGSNFPDTGNQTI